MKRIAPLFCFVLFAFTAGAQIPIATSGFTYTQNFNTLDTIGSSQTVMPAGWSFYEWSGTSANTTYRAGNGSSNTGDTYSFGLSASPERALGSVGSGGVAKINYGAKFINNSGSSINAFTITFKEEQWRRGGSGITDSVRFYYSTAAGNSIVDTGFSTWTQVPSLLMTSVTTAVPAAAINGNDTFRVITATVPVALFAGDSVTLRWYDFNSMGNDDGLSIDSITVSFNNGPIIVGSGPTILALSPAPNATNVSPASNLTITFDKNITRGTGFINVKNRTAQTTQSIDVSSANVVVSGKVATITGVGLIGGTTYHVTFDSTAFDTASFHAMGIYDTSAWKFSTSGVGVGSITQAAALPVIVVNPAGNCAFILLCTLPQAAILNISIYDLAGHESAHYSYNAVKGDNRLALRTSLPAGTYIIRMDDGKQWGSVKAVLQ